MPATEPDATDAASHRAHAIAANNAAWELMEHATETGDGTDELLHRAYAAAYHWDRALDATDTHRARAAWLVARCQAVAGHGELALATAERCLELVRDVELVDFDLAYAHEARARALACLGRLDDAAGELRLAQNVAIADRQDRELVEADLMAAPWFGLDVPGE